MIAQAYDQFVNDFADDLTTAVDRTFVENIPEGFEDEDKTMPVTVDIESLRRSPGASRPVNRHVVRR